VRADSRAPFALTTFAEAIGDQTARSLAPIIAVSVLGAGTAWVGLLHSSSLVMFLLLSLPLGHLGDRLARPVAMMSLSTAARIVVSAAGIGAWLLGRLEGTAGLALLVAMMLVIGIADVAYTTGRGILVPRLVPADGIRALMGTVQTAAQIGTVLSPLLLAGILATAAPPLAWVGVIAAYLVSLFTQRALGGHDDAPPRDRGRPNLREGVAHLLRERTLRSITIASALSNSAAMAANTLLPVFALTLLDVGPAMFAALAGIGALTGVAGAASASAITECLGLRRVRVIAALVTGGGVLPVLLLIGDMTALPGPPSAWIGLCFALSGACTSIAAVAGADLVPRLTPRDMLGAVAGAQRTVAMGSMPLAALLVGALGEGPGPIVAGVVWLALTVAAAVPVLRLHDST
jgi:MFS family permease